MVQPGGQVAVCENCGVRYSIGRMREKVQEITGTVRVEGAVQARQTGTEDDVSQWRSLLDKYYAAGDFQAAESIVKKILEAVPSDEQANKIYDELQVLKFMEIKNGVLVKYTGLSETVTIPSCVKEIAYRAFESCTALKHVYIPESVTHIGRQAFYLSGLQSIIIPESVTHIESQAFYYSGLQSVVIPNSVISIGEGAFNCSCLESVTIPDRFDDEKKVRIFGHRETDEYGFYEYSSYCPWYNRYKRDMDEKHQIEWRKSEGRCQYCGWRFSVFTGKCKHCGKPKDY